MADTTSLDLEKKDAGYNPRRDGSIGERIAVGIYYESIIPEGTIDPVYEAKARVLNRAVCLLQGHHAG
jgi:hypothetical protein